MRVILLFLLVFSFSFGKNLKLKDTPDELSNYYPPKSEKMEFVELMHSLSLSVTGIVVNLKEEDWKNVHRWAEKLEKDYLKIGKMVDKWDRLLKKEDAKNLVKFAKEKNKGGVRQSLQAVGRSCTQCHKNYKLSAKVKYHSPDFSGMKIEDPVTGLKYSVEDYMKAMTDDFKQMRIHAVEGEKTKTRKTGFNFIRRFEGMTQICSDCHTNKLSEEIYFGIEAEKHLTALREAVVNMDVIRIKKEAKWLSENNCAKCHNVHETPYLLKERFEKRK
ncbi:hypothetical protein [Persephonella sp.]